MDTKQDDHNRGQAHGSQGDFWSDIAPMMNPFASEHYVKGYQHGERQRTNKGRGSKKTEGAGSGYGGSDVGLGGLLIGIPFLLIAGWFVYNLLAFAWTTRNEPYKPKFLPTIAVSNPPDAPGVSFYTPDYPRGNVRAFVTDSMRGGNLGTPINVLSHKSGTRQIIYVATVWDGPPPSEGKQVRVELFRDGTPLSAETTRIEPSSRGVAVFWEDDWPVGRYVARVSPEGGPSQDFAFSVVTPTELPGDGAIPAPVVSRPLVSPAAIQDAACYNGIWQENKQNGLTWMFSLDGNTLRISRNDGFVAGVFENVDNQWVGYLNWGNGERWDRVILYAPNQACNEIRTNQSWRYKR